MSSLPNNLEALNDHFFLAPDENSYRILLVMHRLYGNENREFVINLVETLTPISREGDKNTSILTAAIMLSHQNTASSFSNRIPDMEAAGCPRRPRETARSP